MSAPTIHIISTVNGQVNEGMRNVATYIAKAFEKDHEVRYSGLKSVGSIIRNSRACDVTMIFARANKLVYWLSRIVAMFSKNVWIVCVQKADDDFTALVQKHPLKANYLTIVEMDLDEIVLRSGYRKELFSVGIKADKFCPVDKDRQAELKAKYGFSPNRPLVIHVGHCSAGRGLEDFAAITDADRMVVASGMFENAETAKTLEDAGVKIHKGYLEHVEEIYQMADVYLFPTHSTEFVISIPLSVMEALSCGVPVIGYKDFQNLAAIPAESGAVTLINNQDELNKAVMKAAKRKADRSYLTSPKTWGQVADDVLTIIQR
jgi:glycosyltransferase involved in cell wall biosynthesis